jgi:glycosyltransferase involved in cell wall biosynthesis
MRIGFVSFRLAGTDGVSLEAAKWSEILRRMGHQIYAFAGVLDEAAPDEAVGRTQFGLAHFAHPDITWITERAFGEAPWDEELRLRMGRAEAILTDALRHFVNRNSLELIVPENVFAIPLNLPLSLALRKVVAESGIPALAHHHDFYWERARYSAPAAASLLRQTLPPNLPNLRHVVINSVARRALAERGFDSRVVPNILDFSSQPPGPDAYNADLRQALGLAADERFLLQPTRVIRRKGIEHSIDLASRLEGVPIHLVISHHAEHDSLDYLDELRALAGRTGVRLTYAPDLFGPYRGAHPDGGKRYSFWDAYARADFVTYPSRYEGFGNALLEAVYMRRPLLVNRYPVYREDIEPTGLRAVTMDGEITDEVVASARALLDDPDLAGEMTEHNYAVASRHFSYAYARPLLEASLQSFGAHHA